MSKRDARVVGGLRGVDREPGPSSKFVVRSDNDNQGDDDAQPEPRRSKNTTTEEVTAKTGVRE